MSAADSGAPAAGYCRHCGKMLTPETLREVKGAFYCPDCLAASVGQARPRPEPGGGRAAAAAALGVIPGLGAVYNGEYWKALIHVLVFASIIALIPHQPVIFALVLAAWVFYMPFEAYHTAKAKIAAGGGQQAQSDAARRQRETLGPILLIALGSLALLKELNIIDIDRILDFWPLGLIALGVWMLVKRQEGNWPR